MKLRIVLIRNGSTEGGQAGKYLGLVDESLSDEGRRGIGSKLREGAYPPVELVFSSPMRRCRETAGIVYGNIPAVLLDNLGPLDLGHYSGKAYHQIVRDKQFAEWAEDAGLPPLGGGDRPYDFQARCTQAFRSIAREVQQKGIESVAIVTHRQVAGAILQRFLVPRRFYRTWKMENAGGYHLEYEQELGTLRILATF